MCSSTASTTGPRSASSICTMRRGRVVGRGHRQEAVDLLDRPAHRHVGGGTAVGDALGQGADVLLDHGRVGRVAGQQLLHPLGRVGRLVLRDLGRPHLRAGHVVHRQLVLLLVQRLELVLAHEDEQVARDDLLRVQAFGGTGSGLVERRIGTRPRRRRARPARGPASGR